MHVDMDAFFAFVEQRDNLRIAGMVGFLWNSPLQTAPGSLNWDKPEAGLGGFCLQPDGKGQQNPASEYRQHR
ncbi:MAG: hypothetical protein ACREJD_00415 [Phycisphaerales bacterium]